MRKCVSVKMYHLIGSKWCYPPSPGHSISMIESNWHINIKLRSTAAHEKNVKRLSEVLREKACAWRFANNFPSSLYFIVFVSRCVKKTLLLHSKQAWIFLICYLLVGYKWSDTSCLYIFVQRDIELSCSQKFALRYLKISCFYLYENRTLSE